MLPRSVFIGYDPRPAEVCGFSVALASLRANFCGPLPTYGLVLSELQARGLYTRPIERWIGRRHDNTGKTYVASEPALWDAISDAPMATEFAISRFLIPHLVREQTKQDRLCGWALFMECDMMVRRSLDALFMYDAENQKYAVMCVKHRYEPSTEIKMDGQIQTVYPRKNWSSFMLINCDHPANLALTPEIVNSWAGRDLHAFKWLDDELIGELDPSYNWLVGDQPEPDDVRVVHYTLGVPAMQGRENAPYADEWRAHLDRIAA